MAGDASATYGSDDPGWFTYTDYETSAIRRLRAGVTVEARATERIAFLAEIRAETGVGVTPYAWYVRVSPLDSGLLDIQAGRIPPVFGTFSRRSYPQDNPLIGSPQTYQYLTSVRPDAIPATADELLASKGSGWLVITPVGNPEPHNGVPDVAAEQWDTGVQIRIGRPELEAAVAYTVGSLSAPKVKDDNRGRQIAGRLAWRPVPAFTVGVSAASGTFVPTTSGRRGPTLRRATTISAHSASTPKASWGRWLIRGEFVVNDWRVPPLDAPHIVDPLRSRSGYVEAKIRLRPALLRGGAGRRDLVRVHREREREVTRGKPTSRAWSTARASRFAGACWSRPRSSAIGATGGASGRATWVPCRCSSGSEADERRRQPRPASG